MIEPGTVVDDRYEIAELIGEGGMAIVYLADDRKHHRQVAGRRPNPTSSHRSRLTLP